MNEPSSATPDSLIWYILGAGSLGGLWAAKLSGSVPVTLLVRDASQKTQQLRLYDGATSRTIVLAQEDSCAVEPPIERLLVTTKSYDTLNALENFAHRFRSETQIYLMQNGMGSQEAVASRFNSFSVFAVTTTEGANQSARFEIHHAGQGVTWIGPLTPKATLAQAGQCAEVFQRSGFFCKATPDIREKLWQKLAINCAINPFTALLDCPNGDLPHQTFFVERIEGLCQEIAEAMCAAGYPTAAHEIGERVQQVIKSTAHNISSMLQDVRAGRRTEIDAINGYLVDFCQQQGIACPISRELASLVAAKTSV